MNRVVIAIGVVVMIVVGLIAFNSKDESVLSSQTSKFSTIQTQIDAGAKLYDVRTSQEYAAGHFANAQNWTLQDMEMGDFPVIDKKTKLYVYCQSGNRSSQATRLLKEAGFTNVTDLGGLADVRKSGGTLQ